MYFSVELNELFNWLLGLPVLRNDILSELVDVLVSLLDGLLSDFNCGSDFREGSLVNRQLSDYEQRHTSDGLRLFSSC